MTDVPAYTRAPLFRRLWLVVTLTALLLTMPVALIIILTGPIYRKRADGWRPISNRSRFIFGAVLVIWLIAATVRELLLPGGFKGEWERSGDTQVATKAETKAEPKSDAPPGGAVKADNYSNDAPEVQAKTPDMNVTVGGEYDLVTVTANDDQPFRITRVVLNGREGEKGCDIGPVVIREDMTADEKEDASHEPQLPTEPLKRGDQAQYRSSCGQTLSVAIYTDRGVSEYKFERN